MRLAQPQIPRQVYLAPAPAQSETRPSGRVWFSIATACVNRSPCSRASLPA